MSFLIRNTTGAAVPIDDLGIEVPANSTYDLISESPYDVAISTDLANAITTGDIVVLDPRLVAPVYPGDAMSASVSQTIVDAHNDPLYGIRGANIDDLDDVDTTGGTQGDILQLNGSGSYVVVAPSVVGGSIALGDLSDVADGIGSKPITSFYVLVGDGAGGAVVTDGTTDTTVFIPFIEDTVGGVFTGGTYGDITFTYNGATNKVDAYVNDSYLRNNGDTLDSGTLNIASGASFVIATGATGTIVDAPTNPEDIANKAYVDSVAQGTDIKDSVHHSTSPVGGDIGGTYNPTGGSAGSGAFTGATLTIDGLTPAGTGDRVLIKNQSDAKQNGIYIVTAINSSPATMDLERAPDQDGTPANEVSSGNLVFVENGTVNANTSWIVTGDGILTLNVDDINWTQFAGSGSFTAGPGLGIDGSQFYLDTGNLTSITIDPLDEIAFNDVSDVAPKNDKKRSFAAMITDLGLYTSTNLTASDGVLITGGDIQLDITGLATLSTPSLNAEMVFDAGGTGTHNKATVFDFFHTLDVPHGFTVNGIMVRTADDTYASRTIVSSIVAGREGTTILNGDGVSGNPEVGVDIAGTGVSGNNMASADTLLMYNGTNNVAVSGTQIANGVSSILGGLGNAYTTINGDTGTTTATSSTDTLAFTNAVNGGLVTFASDGGPDTITFAIDADNLASGAGTVDTTDYLIVSEGAGAANTKKYTFAQMIADLNISTSGSLVGNDGVQVVGSTVSLDFAAMPAQGGIANALPVDVDDTIAVDPVVSGVAGTHKKVTFNDMIRDLDIVYGLGGDGIAVQTASDTYVSRTLTASTAAGEQGILISDGDGIAGNPTWGLGITPLVGSGDDLVATDLLVMYDGTNNVKVTGQQLADGVSTLLGGVGNAYTTITGDTGSATAATSSDTLNFTGLSGGGITTTVVEAAPDAVSIGIDFNLLNPRVTAVTSAMLLGIGEGAAQPTTTRSLGNVLSDLGVPSGVGTLTGILVSNGAGVYTATTIAVDGVGAFDGLSVTNANGVPGSPTLGLDINGSVAAVENLAATDEVIVYNVSATANQKMTGQELADGVSTMIGLGGVTISTINAQQVLTLVDTTRANKILSVSETEFIWSENRVSNNDWISIGGARDAQTGHIMPMNGTIVRITAHTSDDNNVAKVINLYLDGALSGGVGTFAGAGGESTIVDAAYNVDFIQGQKLRLRAGGGGKIEDTTISIFVKWRA